MDTVALKSYLLRSTRTVIHFTAIFRAHISGRLDSGFEPRQLYCNVGVEPGVTIDISQYRLLFGFFMLYTDRVPFELLDCALRSPPMKGELRWRGANSISKFDHHNINGGAVPTIHDVTGRRLVSPIWS
jgi:hypothetical protein